MIFRSFISAVLFIFLVAHIVWYEAIALALSLYFLLDLIDSIGRKMPFLEIVVAIAFLTWVAMPVVAYEIFNEYDALAKLWITFMPTPAPEYFSYSLPATLLFVLGLKMPLMGGIWKMPHYNARLKSYLAGKSYIGIYLIAIGIAATFLIRVTPESLRNIVQNFALLTYVGMFYVLYSPFKHKTKVVLFCVGLTLAQSISSGMYGQLIFMTVISTLILLAGKKIKWRTKTLVLGGGVFLIFLIQSIKFEYRAGTWSGLERSADPSLFGQLIWQRLTNPSEIFQPERIFNMAVRANQGNIVSKVMNYVPKFEPFAQGRTVLDAVTASLAPRFLWPDKPRAGGADMVCRYVGDCESVLRGISYNVGPIGEAYINFGKIGGCVFMFFYGILFNFLFKKALLIARNTPSLILWFPLLFISFFTMENDVLSFLNSFVKSAFFVFVMFKSANLLFKISL